MSIAYNVIGRHIRAARKEQKLTQDAVAEAIGVSTAHFGKVERGDRPINLHRLSELSLLLHVPLEKLVEGSVIAESNEDAAQIAASESSDFLDTIEATAKGCSPEAMNLMIQLCVAVANDDKSRRSL